MRSVRLFIACGLLIVSLHGNLITQVEATTSPKSSGTLIRVWTIGSPHRGDLPPAVVPSDLRRRAEGLGYTIEVETFRAAGFAAKFRQALLEHNEPEILTFDNYGVVRGVQTQTGWIEGVASDPRVDPSFVLVHEALSPLQQRGWVMLVRSAVNYEAARTLSMQPPVCESQYGPAVDSASMQPVLRQAEETAVSAARAYLDCDFLPAQERSLSSGYLMSGGKSAWRVWSINKSGDVAFSKQHSYKH